MIGERMLAELPYQADIDRLANHTPIYDVMSELITVPIRKPGQAYANGGRIGEGVVDWGGPGESEEWIPHPPKMADLAAFFGPLLASIYDADAAVKSFQHIDDYGVQSVYCGTVPRTVVAKRRRDGKAARKARRTNRR